MSNIENLIQKNIPTYTEEDKTILKEQLEKDLEFMTKKEIEDLYDISNSKRKRLFRLLNITKKSCWKSADNLIGQNVALLKRFSGFESQSAEILKFSRTFDKGNYIESKVICRALELGYEIYTPAFNGYSSDMILIKEGKCWKVQVKSCQVKRFNIGLGITKQMYYKEKMKTQYTKEEVDVFITYATELDVYLWIPFTEDLYNKSCLSIEFRPNSNCYVERKIKDFIWRK